MLFDQRPHAFWFPHHGPQVFDGQGFQKTPHDLCSLGEFGVGQGRGGDDGRFLSGFAGHGGLFGPGGAVSDQQGLGEPCSSQSDDHDAEDA